jgi:1-acyl-sn-glycerol-3-phosphate acyltransferase
MVPRQQHVDIPSAWLVRGFVGYSRRLMRKHFHAFAVDSRALSENPVPPDSALIVYANHPGWWDPLVAVLLKERFFPQRHLFAPIDQEALEKYRVLKKLGFFGIARDRRAGVTAFLQNSRDILRLPSASIWLTPEGRFCDPRDHQAELMPGLAHLASRWDETSSDGPNRPLYLVPLAIEYPFWEERLPEALCRFGSPITARGGEKASWHQQLTEALRTAQRSLAHDAQNRHVNQFDEVLWSGATRTSWYDRMRSWSGRWRGKQVELSHGKLFQPSHSRKKEP